MAKSILEAGHQAAIEEVKKSAPAKVQADVTLSGVEGSINVTQGPWTFTAYVRRLWKGAVEAGARIERPLGLFSRFKS